MKAQIRAGAEIDFLTKRELNDVIEGQFRRTHRLRFKRVPFAGRLPVRVAAPESGFVWSVGLCSVTFDFDDAPRVYAGEHEDAALVGLDRETAQSHVLRWSSKQLVLFGTESLIVSGTGAARRACGLILVQEVPNGHEWNL